MSGCQLWRHLLTEVERNEQLNYSLRNPQDIQQIASYELPSDDDLIKQSINQITLYAEPVIYPSIVIEHTVCGIKKIFRHWGSKCPVYFQQTWLQQISLNNKIWNYYWDTDPSLHLFSIRFLLQTLCIMGFSMPGLEWTQSEKKEFSIKNEKNGKEGVFIFGKWNEREKRGRRYLSLCIAISARIPSFPLLV